MRNELTKIAVAEAIGTFALVFIGVLSINAGGLAGAPGGTVSLVTIALAHGLTIAVMVAALGAISGGHFNPAITFGFVVTGRMRAGRGAVYWAAQLAGATVAGVLLALLFGPEPVAAGTPNLARTITPGAGTFLEIVTTFFLVLVVFGTVVDERAPRAVFPLAIGLTVALDIMAIGPLTGGAMNPARAFGPALAAGFWSNHAVYWIGPLIGGALAALLMHFVLIERAPSPVVAERGGPAPAEERAGA